MWTATKLSEDAASKMQVNAGLLLNSFDVTNPVEPEDADIVCETTGDFSITCTPETQDFFEDEQDDYKIEWVIPNAQKNEMEPILLTLHPGKKSHELAAHHGEEFGYVLKGNVTLVRENKRYKLKAQETFYLDGTKSHYLYNHGKSDAKVLWITTPPTF